jgi:hypothetical protein
MLAPSSLLARIGPGEIRAVRGQASEMQGTTVLLMLGGCTPISDLRLSPQPPQDLDDLLTVMSASLVIADHSLDRSSF